MIQGSFNAVGFQYYMKWNNLIQAQAHAQNKIPISLKTFDLVKSTPITSSKRQSFIVAVLKRLGGFFR